MVIERAAGGASLIDVLERVLDKGIVIDAVVRVSLVGVDLLTSETSVVVVHAAPRPGTRRRAIAPTVRRARA